MATERQRGDHGRRRGLGKWQSGVDKHFQVYCLWVVSPNDLRLVRGMKQAAREKQLSGFGRLCVKIMIPSSIEQLILEYKYSMERHELHKRMLTDFRDTWFSLIFRRFCRRVIAFLEL